MSQSQYPQQSDHHQVKQNIYKRWTEQLWDPQSLTSCRRKRGWKDDDVQSCFPAIIESFYSTDSLGDIVCDDGASCQLQSNEEMSSVQLADRSLKWAIEETRLLLILLILRKWRFRLLFPQSHLTSSNSLSFLSKYSLYSWSSLSSSFSLLAFYTDILENKQSLQRLGPM